MEEVTTRPAQRRDAKTIYSFICQLENIGDADYDLFHRYYLQNLKDPTKIHLLAVVPPDTIIGYVSCYGQLLLHHMGMVYEIQEMFVDKQFRGKGIGKYLLDELENRLKDCPHESFEVTTNMFREDAARFYKRNGFALTHWKLVKT